MVTVCTTCSKTDKLCSLSTCVCVCVFITVVTTNTIIFPNSMNGMAITKRLVLFEVGTPSLYGAYNSEGSPSIHPCMALQPLLGSGLPQKALPFFCIPSLLLHPCIPRICTASIWKTCSYLVFWFSTDPVL